MAEVSSVILVLKPQCDSVVPEWLGRAAQANFMHTLEILHPEMSLMLHDMPGAKPFTSSTLIGARKRGDMIFLSRNDRLHLRYTTVHPLLTSLLRYAILPNWSAKPMLLHERPLEVVDIRTDKGSNTWADQADYVQLVDEAPTHHEVTLTFTSPTSFRRTGGYFTPLPQPELVFSSLLDRWNAFAPFGLPDYMYDKFCSEVEIVRAQIQTETLSFAGGKKGTVPGFTGKVTYRFLCESRESRRYLNALASFAKYSGVGVKTTVGMGQVRVL